MFWASMNRITRSAISDGSLRRKKITPPIHHGGWTAGRNVRSVAAIWANCQVHFTAVG
jgi:hypothetical protein